MLTFPSVEAQVMDQGVDQGVVQGVARGVAQGVAQGMAIYTISLQSFYFYVQNTLSEFTFLSSHRIYT